MPVSDSEPSKLHSTGGRYLTKEDRLRQRVLSDWLGVPQPLDLNRRITKAGDHLEGLIRKLGLDQGVDEERLIEDWQAIAGEFVARHTRPSRVVKGVLEVQVLQPAMRFHLEQMKAELTRKLKEALGKDVVRTVRFTLG